MTTKEPIAAARPDLSHLLETAEGRAKYTRLALAEIVWGAAWSAPVAFANGYSGTDLCANGDVLYRHYGPYDGLAFSYLPDPERDPAAAWELCEREDVVVARGEGGRFVGVVVRSVCTVSVYDERRAGTSAIDLRCGPAWVPAGFEVRGVVGPERPIRASAAIAAVLHKYASDPAWADLIRPLLDAEVSHG